MSVLQSTYLHLTAIVSVSRGFLSSNGEETRQSPHTHNHQLTPDKVDDGKGLAYTCSHLNRVNGAKQMDKLPTHSYTRYNLFSTGKLGA